METTVGTNVKVLREKQGITQQMLGDYLGIKREQINYYENGKRPIPSNYVTKIAELFAVDEYDLYQEDEALLQTNVAFAFRSDNLSVEDLKAIASFKKVAMNYLKMQTALLKDEQ